MYTRDTSCHVTRCSVPTAVGPISSPSSPQPRCLGASAATSTVPARARPGQWRVVRATVVEMANETVPGAGRPSGSFGVWRRESGGPSPRVDVGPLGRRHRRCRWSRRPASESAISSSPPQRIIRPAVSSPATRHEHHRLPSRRLSPPCHPHRPPPSRCWRPES